MTNCYKRWITLSFSPYAISFYFCLQVVHLKHQAVSKKRDTRHAVSLDAENNSIQCKDIVKVIDGPHSVRKKSLYVRKKVEI